MQATNAAVKQTAKTALREGGWQSVWVTAIALFAAFVGFCSADFASMAFGAVGFWVAIVAVALFLLFPLFLGVLRWFWRLLMGTVDDLPGLFHYFTAVDRYKRALSVGTGLAVRGGVAGIVTLLPSALLTLFSQKTVYSFLHLPMPSWSSALWLGSQYLRVAGLVLLAFYLLRYYLAPFLAVADEDMAVEEAFYRSRIIAARTTFDFLSLVVSLLLWLLLSLLVFPLLLTLPYGLACYLVHARFAVAEYNGVVKATDPSFSTEI